MNVAATILWGTVVQLDIADLSLLIMLESWGTWESSFISMSVNSYSGSSTVNADLRDHRRDSWASVHRLLVP